MKAYFFVLLFYHFKKKTLPKAQRTRGFSSYHKFLHKSWSNFIFRISTKHLLQNLDQISVSQLKFDFKSLTNPTFRIPTKIQLHNLNQTSAAKYWPDFSFKILPELQLLTPDQTLCWKSKQKFSFLTKPQLPNLQIVANTIIISNRNNINKFGVGIFTGQGHINKVY